jgi:phospholipid/cholesterol/gamma-HCH transport system substrate-binding protein
METRANYLVTGAFALGVVVGVFGFIYWFQNSGGGSERSSYRVVFASSVSGLRTGASVLFNGIRVGEVSGLALDARDPRKVVATISVERAVPVRGDTRVALTFRGLTGITEIALTGGAADAPLVAADGGGPPTLYADQSAGADVTQAARDVLSRIDGLVAENESALRSSLHNVEIVTSTLAQNSQRLDNVMAGLENLTGSGDSRGEIAEAAEAIRKLAENLDKHTDEISAGLTRFSDSGLKEFEAFAVDGRRTLAELNKAIRNIDQHPTRLIFGR